MTHSRHLEYIINDKKFYVHATRRVVAVPVLDYEPKNVENLLINIGNPSDFIRLNYKELTTPPEIPSLTRPIPRLYSDLTSRIAEFFDARSVARMNMLFHLNIGVTVLRWLR